MNYCSGCTFEEIRAKTMALHRRAPLDLIIVDYLNLIQVNPAGRGEVRDTMDLALGDVCRKLKNLQHAEQAAHQLALRHFEAEEAHPFPFACHR